MKLSNLLRVHRALESSFAAHQAALLEKDLIAAREHLEAFRRRLQQHVDDEEQWILPAYEALPSTTERYAKLYRGEHEKLLKISAELAERLEALPSPPSAADVISLLDRECFFKDLLSHHDLREQNDLYPALDKHLSEEQRAAIFEKLEEKG